MSADAETHDPRYQTLIDFLSRIPAVEVNDSPSRGLGSGGDAGGWWVKFSIDIDHDLAWETVQELGHALNSLTLDEGIATIFKPVSPPPYLNGGPDEFLSWVIEAPASLEPSSVATLLESRLPQPVDLLSAWVDEEGDGGDDDADSDDDADDEADD